MMDCNAASSTESFIVNWYDDTGHDHDAEFNTLPEAVEFLEARQAGFDEESWSSPMAEPTLSCPCGCGREYCLETGVFV